jgi:hypothetical protein
MTKDKPSDKSIRLLKAHNAAIEELKEELDEAIRTRNAYLRKMYEQEGASFRGLATIMDCSPETIRTLITQT